MSDSERDAGDRTVLVDASVFITLPDVGAVDLVSGLRGDVVVPAAVEREITDDPAASALEDARTDGWLDVIEVDEGIDEARIHLGVESGRSEPTGDVALLGRALDGKAVVVTDDKPLRETCKALSVPISGSIGVLVRAVERGDADPDDAKATLYAMDEVGARLSASLVRRAERLIERATGE